MKGFAIVEPLTGIFFALKAMHHFLYGCLPFFVILITLILIANMKYFTPKIGYFLFLQIC